MLTYSRSSYFAYLIGMAVIAWAKRAPKFFLTVLLIFILTILVLPRPGGEGVKLERESTVQARIRNWKQSLVIARDHPIFGVGFNAYRYAQRDYGFLGKDWQTSHAGAGADSSILFVMATTGLVGLAVYLWFWVSLLRVTRYGLVALASSLALLAHSFFNNSLFYPWIMVWFWVLLGLRRDD
jgi:O-antigen ligase